MLVSTRFVAAEIERTVLEALVAGSVAGLRTLPDASNIPIILKFLVQFPICIVPFDLSRPYQSFSPTSSSAQLAFKAYCPFQIALA